MKKGKKQGRKFIIIFIVLILIVGYAIISTQLKIDGLLHVTKANWDVHFENIQLTEGSVNATTIPTSDNTTTTELEYVVDLAKPGDFYEFTVDVVNNGTMDAMVNSISNKIKSVTTGYNVSLPNYLQSTITYVDGGEIQRYHYVPKRQGTKKGKETIKVRIEFKKDINVSDLPSTDTSLNFKFTIDYVQADNRAKSRYEGSDNQDVTTLSDDNCPGNKNIPVGSNTVCKRAIKLHQELCRGNGCSSMGYSTTGSQGTEIVKYGNCGTRGETIENGDAFTCDVNGDGFFDELTERFYYVSDYYDTTNKSFDSSTAVLVYYNNTDGIYASNKSVAKYYETAESWNGFGEELKNKLPTTNQWSNVSLKNTNRAILAEFKTTHDGSSITVQENTHNLPTSFSYDGYAARLLTAKELMSSCGLSEVGNTVTSELNSCYYLNENTMFATNSININGYWLETPTDNGYILFVLGYNNMVVFNPPDYTSLGVRPVIEVPKTKIAN